jgi:hypothetical protein
MDASRQVPLVLDYAKPIPRLWLTRALSIVGCIAFILLIAALGERIGYALSPIRWHTNALLQILPSDIASRENETPNLVAQRAAANAATLQSPQATIAVLQNLSARGHSQANSAGATQWLEEHVQARSIPNSRLIAISFTSSDPCLSLDALNAYVSYAATPTNGGTPASLFTVPSAPFASRSPYWRASGAVFGTVSGIVVVLLWRRARLRSPMGSDYVHVIEAPVTAAP